MRDDYVQRVGHCLRCDALVSRHNRHRCYGRHRRYGRCLQCGALVLPTDELLDEYQRGRSQPTQPLRNRLARVVSECCEETVLLTATWLLHDCYMPVT